MIRIAAEWLARPYKSLSLPLLHAGTSPPGVFYARTESRRRNTKGPKKIFFGPFVFLVSSGELIVEVRDLLGDLAVVRHARVDGAALLDPVDDGGAVRRWWRPHPRCPDLSDFSDPSFQVHRRGPDLARDHGRRAAAAHRPYVDRDRHE